MDRQQVVETLLFPVDWALGTAIGAIKERETFELASHATYWSIRNTLRQLYQVWNELEAIGLENVPRHGGVLLASNHQSWLDAQILGVSCPRRVHFIAKVEFRQFPVLRHLLELSESIFVTRGGDQQAFDAIVEALRQEKVLAIYPEGTIPGEEDIPRRAIDPRTGLLPGKTGAVRLALMARVPLVPVGVSGTGRAFPPEVYPRLELLRLPASSSIRIRYGEPMDLSAHYGRELSYEQLREITDELMLRISQLVDHRRNYAPISVPVPPPNKSRHIAVLLLHGFTSSAKAVDGLLPHLERAGIAYERPVLRGHGTRYQDLRGIRARDWYVDAERALLKLWHQDYKVVVVGLSMGGLVALDLAIRHPEMLAGVVAVAPAVKFKKRLAPLTPFVHKVIRYWRAPKACHDPLLAQSSTNYQRFPVDAFASLYRYGRRIAERLPEVHVPIRILQSKVDQVVAPESANIVYEKVSSQLRQIVWFEKSGHEMMLDMEAETVFQEIMAFIEQFREAPKATAQKV